ncbi:ganglioside GM2 activator [Galendromus occidentalis]|uniref:Ganglioside GM2 activator n=1 Tax=Galendromus occidentalis TaxID=34638 RepID=A0AAJ6QV40_9ACAR|nr:ganglioside GM2 activator [Galendromus occidentalis]
MSCIMMKFFILFCFLLGAASAQRVTFKNCESDKSGYGTVNVIDIKDPILFPSNVSADIDIEVTKAFPEGATVQLTVYRVFRLFGKDRHIKIPCVMKAGSCEYDVCKLLLKSSKPGATFDLCTVWPEGKPCVCPIPETNLRKENASLSFPTLPGLAKFLVSGNYAVNAKFIDPSDKQSFFCLDIKATLG